MLGSFPFYIGISAVATPLFRDRLDEKFKRGAENQAFLVESVNGVETLKAMAVEPQMQRRWEEQLAGYVAASFRVLSLGNTASQLVQLVNKLGHRRRCSISAPGSSSTASLTVGELVAFNILAGRVSAPVLRLAQIWQDFHQARLSVARLGDILNTTPEPIYNPGQSRVAGDPRRGIVRACHVPVPDRRAGSAARRKLQRCRPGRSSASSVRRARARARWPSWSSGSICRKAAGCWSTASISTWSTRHGCAARSASVLQENVLFNRSVRDNIALADPAMPIERIIAAAQVAGAHEFILELPNGYDTIVGERGSSLSGGQRQRIAIARALVMNPRILIFDEATSALDYESERIIQQNMPQIARSRTVFIIAHRLSTVRRSDRIITIDRGRLVEDGTHEELIKTGGRYASLYRLQAGIHEVR